MLFVSADVCFIVDPYGPPYPNFLAIAITNHAGVGASLHGIRHWLKMLPCIKKLRCADPCSRPASELSLSETMSLRAVGLKFSLMREHEKNVNNFECKRDIETGISWFYRAVFHVILESLSPQIENPLKHP